MNGTENNQPEITLSAAEKEVLETLAQGDPPFSQRAGALLAVAVGADLATAGSGAELTENQVRYWLGRFRSKRLDIFPEVQLPSREESVQDTEAEPTLLAAPPESPKLQAPPKVEELTAGTPDPANVIELPASVATVDVAATAAKSKKKNKKKEKAGKQSKKGGKNKANKKDKKKKKKKKKKKGKNSGKKKGKKKKDSKSKQGKKKKKK